MNLGLENIRELLENFLSNTGGRRGREREQTRLDAEGQPGAPGEGQAAGAGQGTDATTGAGETAGTPGESGTETSDSATASQSAGDTGGRPDVDELEEDELVDDLYHRIENLEEEIESNDAQLGTIHDSQQEVAERVEDVNDTIRRLVGVYDRLTNDVNPFTGAGEKDDGFGVFGDDEQEEGFGLGDTEVDDRNAEGETVSFADLKDVIEDAADASADESTGERFEFDEDDDSDIEVQPTERISDTAGESLDDEEDDESDVTLDSLADTYASDVIVFEWLTELVRTAGPAATLRAISYYYEIGWISAEVKDHLESVLSGPDLDIHVDPATQPDELTAEDHADSYTFIMKLDEIHETRREVNPAEPHG